MFKISKNIFLLIIVLLFISSAVFLAYGFRKSPSIVTNNDPEPSLLFGLITREDRIKHIEWAYRNDRPYEQIALKEGGPKDYDGDNIEEIIISSGTTRDEIGNEIPIENETIYKWDTQKQEYYLWKEEKISG